MRCLGKLRTAPIGGFDLFIRASVRQTAKLSAKVSSSFFLPFCETVCWRRTRRISWKRWRLIHHQILLHEIVVRRQRGCNSVILLTVKVVHRQWRAVVVMVVVLVCGVLLTARQATDYPHLTIPSIINRQELGCGPEVLLAASAPSRSRAAMATTTCGILQVRS